jgi:hypothetical protein
VIILPYTFCTTSHINMSAARCYHTERRTDSKGKSSTRTVVRHRDEMMLPITHLIDVSGPFQPKYQVFSLECDSIFECGDPIQAAAYTEVYRFFKNKHTGCDASCDIREEMLIPGFIPNCLGYVNPYAVPFLIKYGKFFYVLFALCGLSWLYRCYFSGATGEEYFVFEKKVWFTGSLPYAGVTFPPANPATIIQGSIPVEQVFMPPEPSTDNSEPLYKNPIASGYVGNGAVMM